MSQENPTEQELQELQFECWYCKAPPDRWCVVILKRDDPNQKDRGLRFSPKLHHSRWEQWRRTPDGQADLRKNLHASGASEKQITDVMRTQDIIQDPSKPNLKHLVATTGMAESGKKKSTFETREQADEVMSRSAMELLGSLVEANVRDAAHTTNLLLDAKDGEIKQWAGAFATMYEVLASIDPVPRELIALEYSYQWRYEQALRIIKGEDY